MAQVIKASDVPPTVLGALARRRVVTGKDLMIVRYEAGAGAEFAAHSHPEEQMGYVIQGKIEFFLGWPEVRHVFEAGTFFHFAPNERHRSRALEESVVIDVFSPPRPEYVGEGAGSQNRQTG
jgi:quercetin dioxygenase-like cupin family protein